jgi:hypothetical protein
MIGWERVAGKHWMCLEALLQGDDETTAWSKDFLAGRGSLLGLGGEDQNEGKGRNYYECHRGRGGGKVGGR